MASKRKSTVPCMIPAKSKHLREEIVLGCLPELLPTIPEDSILSISGQEEEEAQWTFSLSERGAHRCTPCSFQTTDLNLFLNHMDSCHMDFRTQTIFYCLNCRVSLAKFEGLALHNAKTHPELQAEGNPGKAALQVTKRDGVLTVEQMLFTEKENFSEAGVSITKAPIMKMMVKGEHKKIVVSQAVEVQKADISPEKSMAVANGTSGRNAPMSHILTGISSLPVPKMTNTGIQVTRNVKPLWNSAPFLPDINSSLPKVMIPLSSIPTYDPAMDLSSFLKASFGKFPYPTKAELCYLTVVSGFPEEQIKLWFTAQRLKQGISWSPEEIEDTRRRMFNTVFQAAPKALQSQSHLQVPHHYVSSQPASTGASIMPHASKASMTGRKGGVIVMQPGTAQGTSSQKAESTLGYQTSITSIHIHGEKTETGSSSTSKASAIGPTSTNQKQNSSCSEGSIKNLTNIVRKIDYNINNTNGTSKPNTCSAFIYGQEKPTSDTKDSSNSNILTSSKSNNGNIYKSTSHSTICTKKEDSMSDHTSKAKNTDSSIICSSTGAGEFLLVQTGTLVDAFQSKSKLPEQLEGLKQGIIHNPFPEKKFIATMDVPAWEVDKPYHRHSSEDSQLTLGHFLWNAPQSSLCSNDENLQEDNQLSLRSLSAPPENLSPKSLGRAPQVQSADYTVVHYKDHDPSVLEDHAQPSKAVVDRSHFSSKFKQKETDAMLLQQEKSQANNTFYNTDKDEHCRIVHPQHALKKNEGRKIAAPEDTPSFQYYTEVMEDQWESDSSYYEPKTESIKINLKTLNEAEHMAEASRKQINDKHLDVDGISCYEHAPLKKLESHQHTPANEHFVEDKYIKKKLQKQDDQSNYKELETVKSEYLRPERQSILQSLGTQVPVLAAENCEGIEGPSEKAPAKDHWLMKEEESQQDNQSRDCVRGELLKV